MTQRGWRGFIKTAIATRLSKDTLLQPRNAVFLLLLVIPVLYFSTAQSLYDLWIKSGNPVYSHGAIALLIAAYIFFKYWFAGQAARREPDFHAVGLAALVFCSVLWFLAALGSVQILQQLLFIGLAVCLFWFLFGKEILKSLAIPVLVLLTAIPVWDFLNFYLQIATAINVEALLKLSGIPFVREGVSILLPNGTFLIEERCSGLRMFVAMVAISLLCIYQWQLRLGAGIVFMLVSLALAIVINSIRIYIVVVAGYLTDMQHYFVTTDHVMLGWVLFGLILFIFLMLCSRYLLSDRWYSRVAKPPAEMGQDQGKVGHQDSDSNKARRTLALIAGLLGISIGPALAAVYQYQPDKAVPVNVNLARQFNGWTMQGPRNADWQPVYHGADYQDQFVFRNSTGDQVEAFLAYYAFQAEGKEAIHHQNTLYAKEAWKTVSRQRLIKPLSHAPLALNQWIIESNKGNKKLLWQWYYLNSRRMSGGIDAKLAGIRGVLSGDPAIAVLAVATDMDRTYEQAEAVLTSFLTESLHSIESAIDQASVVETNDR
ncbi:MAG TPA: EpsI family protein [Gammaproteobacteria bacterium]